MAQRVVLVFLLICVGMAPALGAAPLAGDSLVASGADWWEVSTEQVQEAGKQVLPAAMQDEERFQEVPEHGSYDRGFTTAELLRNAGIVAIIVALTTIVVLQFRKNVSPTTYRWSMLVGLFILPIVAGIAAMSTTLEETKTVESCASCHVMDPFVDDMLNPESATLAARHYENKWIPTHQCYECHTSYGVHGTLAGKRDGFRHWLLYVTRTWDEPITYAGSYPNANCTACHGGTPDFEEVESHQALALELGGDEVTCTTCHGPPHPVPEERYPESDDLISADDDGSEE